MRKPLENLLDLFNLPPCYRSVPKVWLKGGPVKKEEPVGDLDAPLKVPQAAARIGCSPGTVRMLIRTGQLQGHRVGRHLKTTQRDIDAFRASQQQRPRVKNSLRKGGGKTPVERQVSQAQDLKDKIKGW